jgi:hypothetical protein
MRRRRVFDTQKLAMINVPRGKTTDNIMNAIPISFTATPPVGERRSSAAGLRGSATSAFGNWYEGGGQV